MDQDETVWRIGRFAEMIGKHQNTVDGWFKKLEEAHLHYVSRVAGGVKVYDALDLKVAQYINHWRDKGWQLEAIFNELPSHVELRNFPSETQEVSNQLVGIEELKRILLQDREERTAEVVEAVERYLENRTMQLLESRRNDRMSERKIERQLRSEAIVKWDELPESVRMKKVGWFSKVEDVGARERYIQDYIDTHFEDRISEVNK
jgi:DNA-binding transcriptional MerR regulator